MTRLRTRIGALASVTAAGLTGLSVLTMPADAGEIEFSVMESGTYDVAARQIAEEFAVSSGTTVNISAFPWAVLRQSRDIGP